MYELHETVTPLLILDFKIELPVTARLFEVQEAIKERHGGSVGKVKLCLDNYAEADVLPDMTKMLKEVNIV